MPTEFAETRRNWSRSRRTSSWPPALGQWGRCRQATRTVPIVFAPSPIRSAPASSIAWRGPGGNVTGFTTFEYGIGAKWLELLKEIAPRVTRAAVLREPDTAPASAQFAAIQAVAPSLGVEVSPVDVRDAGEIERAVTAFARAPNGGLIVTWQRVGDWFIAI